MLMSQARKAQRLSDEHLKKFMFRMKFSLKGVSSPKSSVTVANSLRTWLFSVSCDIISSAILTFSTSARGNGLNLLSISLNFEILIKSHS